MIDLHQRLRKLDLTPHWVPATPPRSVGVRPNRTDASIPSTQLIHAAAEIRATLRDRELTGVVVQMPQHRSQEEYTSTALALARQVGSILPETRNASGADMDPVEFVEITLGNAVDSTGAGRHFVDPTHAWPLHTDRTIHEDVGDFVVVCKVLESAVGGGEIRLLHVSDWEDFAPFHSHRLATRPLTWKGDERLAPFWLQSKIRRQPGVRSPVFSDSGDSPSIRFTDFRFRRPDTVEHAAYLNELSLSLETAAVQLDSFQMPVGSMYVINNRRVLHGRTGFSRVRGFQRRLVRICGNLSYETSST